jgi:ubiquinone/menaquinone biosynthesis C-methylase UbiE
VFSSFMFHHLEHDAKEAMLAEIRRVLKPGGRLELLDFGGPEPAARGSYFRRVHRHARLRDNAESTVIALMATAGLSDARTAGYGTVLGGLIQIVYYEAGRPLQ